MVRLMQPAPPPTDVPPAPAGKIECAVNALVQFARFRNKDLDPNDVIQRSGIAPATFWRLMTNRNDRVSFEVLARCCATFQVPISAVLVYWSETSPYACLPIPTVVTASITSYGRVAVILPHVLHGYADIWGEPLTNLHTLVGTQRKTIDALIENQGTLIDFHILARLIDVLTAIAQKPHPSSKLFADWLDANHYTPGTVEMVLRYIPELTETHGDAV